MAKSKINNFKKDTEGKLLMSLVPQEVIDALAATLTYGAAKYGKNNWKTCNDLSLYEDALLRHIGAWRRGEHTDKESGLPHLHHALANLAFLIYKNHKKEL